MSAGDISQRKTILILAVFVLQCCSKKLLDVLPEMWCLVPRVGKKTLRLW
jgi:hypothetical protein